MPRLSAGRLSDRVGRRKVFVALAALVYAAALLVIATADNLNGYLVGMAVSGLGFGMYMAVDLALVVDVLPDTGSAAKDLGCSTSPAPSRSRSRPHSRRSSWPWRRQLHRSLPVAGACAAAGAAAIVPVHGVR